MAFAIRKCEHGYVVYEAPSPANDPSRSWFSKEWAFSDVCPDMAISADMRLEKIRSILESNGSGG